MPEVLVLLLHCSQSMWWLDSSDLEETLSSFFFSHAFETEAGAAPTLVILNYKKEQSSLSQSTVRAQERPIITTLNSSDNSKALCAPRAP